MDYLKWWLQWNAIGYYICILMSKQSHFYGTDDLQNALKSIILMTVLTMLVY